MLLVTLSLRIVYGDWPTTKVFVRQNCLHFIDLFVLVNIFDDKWTYCTILPGSECEPAYIFNKCNKTRCTLSAFLVMHAYSWGRDNTRFLPDLLIYNICIYIKILIGISYNVCVVMRKICINPYKTWWKKKYLYFNNLYQIFNHINLYSS